MLVQGRPNLSQCQLPLQKLNSY